MIEQHAQLIPTEKTVMVKVDKWFDTLSLITVLHFVLFRFFQQSTMFPFVYPDLYKTITLLSLAFVGGIRFLYLIGNKLRSLDDHTARIHLLIKCAIAGSFALPFFYVGLKHDSRPLVFLPFAALCCYDMDARRILRGFTFVVGAALAATVLCCLTGAVKHIIVRSDSTQSYLVSMGLINTSDFASCFTFLFLFAWCARWDKGWLGSILLAALAGWGSWAVFLLTESRTVFLCGLLTAAAILWECLDKNILQKKAGLRSLGKYFGLLPVAFFSVLFTLFVLLVLAYGRKDPTAMQANRLLTDRIRISFDTIKQYGIHPFGATMETMNGKGGTLLPYWSRVGYGYLDIGYAMLAIRYGWVLSLIVTFLWTMTGLRALQRGDARIALAMGIIAFHAFSEARFFDVHYNILLIMPFCSFSPAEAKRGIPLPAEGKSGGRSWVQPATALAFGAGIYFAMPKALSWLRTIFFLNRWTAGVRSFGALTVSLALVAAVIGLWKALSVIWVKRSAKAWAALAIPIVLLISGTIAGNAVIQQGMKDQAEGMGEDAEAIRLAQAAAIQPVYAAEKSELYQRRFGGFAEHAFSSDALCRQSQGTIFTDSSSDLFVTVNYAGAQYALVSPRSGVYSFDSKVIDALSAAGYAWTPYVSSERTCDLVDMAIRNRLSLDENGLLALDGSGHSVTSNLEYDQMRGVYEATYTIILPQNTALAGDQPVCSVIVMGESGQRTIAEETLTAAQFDADRRCVFTLRYDCAGTPRVSYLVQAREGVRLLLEELTWRRIG